MQEQTEATHIKTKRPLQPPGQSKYYRKASREDSCCGKGAFEYRFEHMENDLSNKNFFSVMCSFICYRIKNENESVPKDMARLEEELPIVVPNFKNSNGKIRYTWIGHSTAVIAIDEDINFIIDPVFADRCSPVSFAGPKRYRKPAVQIEGLPTIDAVFVSHDHYDHLDSEALQKLYKRNPQTQFFAGLQSETQFPDKCRIQTLDWTVKHEFMVKGRIFWVTFVPVCHWGRRGAFDKNKRLWGGFVIETDRGKKIFYSGDTGYCDIFKELGQLFGGFDLSILPIGAYLPREMLRFQHIDPEQAVIVHKEIRSKKSVGVHWGTFPLGFEHYLAPKRDLQTAKTKHGLKDDQFICLDHGASLQVSH